ncbi:MAG: flippase-like domain-containing protein [Phycisphaerales bacterium]|nr:flippase-like domain-containing protein [Phycisphaerales bacterium]
MIAVDPQLSPGRSARARSIITAAVAVIMLGAAVAVLVHHRADLGSAISSARQAPAWMLAVAIGLPILNWMFSTWTFWLLTRRVGNVSFAEMAALMGASWLANYLPLKPGLAGRVAYHRAVHGIPVAASSVVIVQALLLGVTATAALIGVTLAISRVWLGGLGPGLVAAALLALLAFAVFHGRVLTRVGAGSPSPVLPTLLAGFAARLGDAAVWVVRYWLAFQIIGSPVTTVQAAALAAIGQAVACLPVVGSALGVREWSVAALASVLPSAGRSQRALSAGLVADLVNRAVELVLAIVIGLASTAWLAAKARRSARSPADPSAPTVP